MVMKLIETLKKKVHKGKHLRMFCLICNFLSGDEVCAYVHAFGITSISFKTCNKIRKLGGSSWDEDHMSDRQAVSLRMWIV